jgi:hypothetical protein
MIMDYTVVCVYRDRDVLILHVQADNVQEAELEAARKVNTLPKSLLRFLAVFEGMLRNLKVDTGGN